MPSITAGGKRRLRREPAEAKSEQYAAVDRINGQSGFLGLEILAEMSL